MSDLIERILILACLLLIAYSAMLVVNIVKADSECLSYGYRNAAVTWDLEKYCIREENASEITVPLSDLE